MMNYVWAILVLVAIIFAIATGKGNEIGSALLSSGETSVNLLLTLAGTISLWSGIMAIAESSGITKGLSTLFNPVLKLLFKDYKDDNKVMDAVSTNITANLIGLGNAATPAGLKAIASMYNGENKINNSMATFIVMNTSSIQIVPTTIVALRLAKGSNAPMEIAPCIWISSICALLVGIASTKICGIITSKR
ncbi:MAG: nucleoside recognition domain-containing protein [Acutalibacteraceae bacterium]|nr:nucleoside recognition domain-containing protein [Acutalibacteraceae bacterium]